MYQQIMESHRKAWSQRTAKALLYFAVKVGTRDNYMLFEVVPVRPSTEPFAGLHSDGQQVFVRQCRDVNVVPSHT